MTDLEKLRKGLECCIKLQHGEPVSCEVCPYNSGRMTCESMVAILEDALAAVEYQHEHRSMSKTIMTSHGVMTWEQVKAVACALDTATWYNGLAEEIVHWVEPGYFDESYGYLMWKWDKFRAFDPEIQHQLEIVWIVCCELFGEWGTSPRSGWIENITDFKAFCMLMTETYREAKEAGLTG